MRAILGGVVFSLFLVSISSPGFSQNSSSTTPSITTYSLPSDFPMTTAERLKAEEDQRKMEALRDQFMREARAQALAEAERAFGDFKKEFRETVCLEDGTPIGLSWDESIKNLYTEDSELVEKFFDYIRDELPRALEETRSNGKPSIREVRLSRRGWLGNLANSLADGTVLELQIDSEGDLASYQRGDRSLAEIISQATQRRADLASLKQMRSESKYFQ